MAQTVIQQAMENAKRPLVRRNDHLLRRSTCVCAALDCVARGRFSFTCAWELDPEAVSRLKDPLCPNPRHTHWKPTPGLSFSQMLAVLTTAPADRFARAAHSGRVTPVSASCVRTRLVPRGSARRGRRRSRRRGEALRQASGDGEVAGLLLGRQANRRLRSPAPIARADLQTSRSRGGGRGRRPCHVPR